MKTRLMSLLGLLVMIGWLVGCSPTAAPMNIAARSVSAASSFTLTSPAVIDGGTLPVEYTCDGDGSTLALAWSGAPTNTREHGDHASRRWAK